MTPRSDCNPTHDDLDFFVNEKGKGLLIVTHGAGNLEELIAARYANHPRVTVIPYEKLHVGALEPCVHVAERSSFFPAERAELNPAQHSFVVLAPTPDDQERFNCTILSGTGPDGLDALAGLLLHREQSAREQLTLLSRLEEFVSVAHLDLSEPNRTISFFSEFLAQDEEGLSDKSRDLLQRMEVAAQRSQLLLKELTRYSRVWLRGYEPTKQSAEEVRSIGEMAMERAIARVGSPTCRLAWDGTGSLTCSERYLSTILEELLANALEFHTDYQESIRIRLSPSSTSGLVVIRVIDNGPGIHDPGNDRLFRPFYRGKRDDELRTGIGLALVRSMVERAGGAIWLKPREEGTTSDLFCALPGEMKRTRNGK